LAAQAFEAKLFQMGEFCKAFWEMEALISGRLSKDEFFGVSSVFPSGLFQVH
jgi:hypothetical protein